jgi:hypothetical protein
MNSYNQHFAKQRKYNSQKIAAVLLLKFNGFLTGLATNLNPTLLQLGWDIAHCL